MNIHVFIRSLVILGLVSLTHINGYAATAVTGKIIINGQEYPPSNGDGILRGNGRQTSETRSLPDFHTIVVTSAIDVTYRPGRDNKALVHADGNLLAAIETQVSDGVLTITSNRSYSSDNPITVDVSGPMIRSLTLEGTGDARLNDLNAPRLRLQTSGTSTLVAHGRVGDLSAVVNGNGNLNLKALKATNATLEVDGVAEIKVFVSENLEARLDGVADVVYYGHPKHIKKHISGVGDVIPGD